MAGGEADCEDGVGGVEDLSEEVGGEGDGAERVEHWEGRSLARSDGCSFLLHGLMAVVCKSLDCGGSGYGETQQTWRRCQDQGLMSGRERPPLPT